MMIDLSLVILRIVAQVVVTARFSGNGVKEKEKRTYCTIIYLPRPQTIANHRESQMFGLKRYCHL
jgi:hypothetical protein